MSKIIYESTKRLDPQLDKDFGEIATEIVLKLLDENPGWVTDMSVACTLTEHEDGTACLHLVVNDPRGFTHPYVSYFFLALISLILVYFFLS